MVSHCLVVGIAIITVVGNAALLATLVIVTLQIQQNNQKKPIDIQGQEESTVENIVTKVLNETSDNTEETDLLHIRRDIADIYNREGNLRKPAIHMEINNDFDTSVKISTLTWHNDPSTSYLGDNITYADGAVTVTISGYYNIYSTIRYNGSGTEDLEYGRIVHNVIMEKKGEEDESPTTLLKNFLCTPVIRRGRLAYTTSSLGGTFYLPPLTKVKVTSSVPKNVDTSPHGSYFGLFLI